MSAEPGHALIEERVVERLKLIPFTGIEPSAAGASPLESAEVEPVVSTRKKYRRASAFVADAGSTLPSASAAAATAPESHELQTLMTFGCESAAPTMLAARAHAGSVPAFNSVAQFKVATALETVSQFEAPPATFKASVETTEAGAPTPNASAVILDNAFRATVSSTPEGSRIHAASTVSREKES